MALEKDARKRLRKFVVNARKILDKDFRKQLRDVFGMDLDTGVVQKIENLQQLNAVDYKTALDLREILAHYRDVNESLAAGTVIHPLEKLLREMTQDVLIRLCAIRMAEERGVISPSLSDGMNSEGFRNYRIKNENAQENLFNAYVKFLKSVCKVLANDLPKVFARANPLGLLFPKEQSFQLLLAEINSAELAVNGVSFWKDDETIGWIFQYFNRRKEITIARDVHDFAPKGSYEIAIRNQFFTPRYVVEFLVDNTLGRLWADETKGNTRLLNDCRSLIWKGEKGKKPKRLRDPRSILILDPACGTMHFGLYAFDLLELIYEECWNFLEENPGSELTEVPENQKPLRERFSNKADFLKAVPKLILEFNLFGIDIDVQAAHTASLALWLKAQKSLDRLKVPASERGRIVADHVIAAVDPIPGPVLAQKIAAAGDSQSQLGLELLSGEMLPKIPETGFLLPLEKSFRSIDDAVGRGKQDGKYSATDQKNLNWEMCRDAVRKALTRCVESTGHSFSERLFARDAMECLKLVDLCTTAFDVIVMNPPFGSPAKGSRRDLGKVYPSSKKEIIGMFVLRALALLKPQGWMGAISSRTVFFQRSSARWRDQTIYGEKRVPVFLDLGLGVMDNAAVEAAAYVIGPAGPKIDTVFVNATRTEKTDAVTLFLQDSKNQIEKSMEIFSKTPGGEVAYWVDDVVWEAHKGTLLRDFAEAKAGLITGNNDRFVRLFWEVEGAQKRWLPLAKGGEAHPFYRDVPTVANWEGNGNEIKLDSGSTIANLTYNYRPAFTWSIRAQTLGLCVFPQGGISEPNGSCVFVKGDEETSLLATGAILNSRAFQHVLAPKLQRMNSSSRYECGMLASAPFPELEAADQAFLAREAKVNFEARRKLDSVHEASRFFLLPEVIQKKLGLLDREALNRVVRESQKAIDEKADALYNLQSPVNPRQEASRERALADPDEKELTDGLLSWAVGVAFGRFDVRLATGERPVPDFGAPFDPYPERAPGRLPEGAKPLIENSGIFVQDPAHRMDLAEAVRQVLHICGLESPVDVRTWLEKDFFDLHLKTTSAAKRTAPLYWPIGTASGDYVLWLYYPKLSENLLFTAIADFVHPRLIHSTDRYDELGKKEKRTPKEETEFSRLARFITELSRLKGDLESLAAGFVPHFDDGVALNAVRLLPTITHKAWRKKLLETKAALDEGKLDWSETAADLYPKRVKEKCKTNPSLRLAHKRRGWFPADQ